MEIARWVIHRLLYDESIVTPLETQHFSREKKKNYSLIATLRSSSAKFQSEQQQRMKIPSFSQESIVFGLPEFFFGEDRESKILGLLNDDSVSYCTVDATEKTLLNVSAGFQGNELILKAAISRIIGITDANERIKFVNHPDLTGFTPLHTAIIHFNDDFGAMLVKYNAVFDIGIPSLSKSANENYQIHDKEEFNHSNLKSLLFEAVNGKMPMTVRELREKGAMLNRNEADLLKERFNVAMAEHNNDLIRIIYLAGVETIMHRNEKEMSLLVYSFVSKNDDLFIGLVEDGARFSKRERNLRLNDASIICEAVERRKLELIKAVVQAGADVNGKSRFEETSLHGAAENDEIEILNVLIELGANVDAVNCTGWSPLMRASFHRSSKVVIALIAAGADVNLKDDGEKKRTALHEAAEKYNLEMIEVLIAAGADVNMTDGSQYKKTPLHLAAERQHIVIVKRLLELGANIDVQNSDPNRISALHLAIMYRDMELFNKCLDSAKNANLKFIRDPGALCKAVQNGNLHIVNQLIEAGIDMNATWHKDHILKAAVHERNFEILSRLLEAGADVNAKVDGIEKTTALHYAARKGKLDFVQVLLKAGADVNSRDDGKLKQTALHKAVEINHIEIVNLLLEADADVNAKEDGEYKRTPMHIAVGKRCEGMVNLLLKAGANLDVINSDGQSALDVAKKITSNTS